jgi:hypothetical protein
MQRIQGGKGLGQDEQFFSVSSVKEPTIKGA